MCNFIIIIIMLLRYVQKSVLLSNTNNKKKKKKSILNILGHLYISKVYQIPKKTVRILNTPVCRFQWSLTFLDFLYRGKFLLNICKKKK